MSRSTQESWLEGPGDLREDVVEDVPVKGESVKIRALSATAANGATSEALTTSEYRGQQVMRVDSVKLDILRFQAGVIEPQFSVEQVTVISAKYGPVFQRVVKAINEISGIDADSIKETEARFPSGGVSAVTPNGDDPAPGDGRPAVPARSGAGTGNDG